MSVKRLADQILRLTPIELKELRRLLGDDFLGSGVREPRRTPPGGRGAQTVADAEDRSVKGRTL